MNRFIKIYLVGTAILFVPLLFKEGPQTMFYWYVGWLPLILMATGAFLSTTHLVAHTFFVAMIAALTWLNYPIEPFLDTMRQVIHETAPIVMTYAQWLIVADFAIAIFQNRKQDHNSVSNRS